MSEKFKLHDHFWDFVILFMIYFPIIISLRCFDCIDINSRITIICDCEKVLGILGGFILFLRFLFIKFGIDYSE